MIKKIKKLFPLLSKYLRAIQTFEKKFAASLDVRQRQAKRYYSGDGTTDMPKHKDVEVLFHATPFLKEIKATGLQVGKKKALGGNVEGISFTADFEIAKAIVQALREVIAIAKGQVSPEDVIRKAKAEGMDVEKFDAYNQYVMGKEQAKSDYNSPRYHAWYLYRSYLGESRLRYDPLFFGVNIEDFENMNPRNVGVIAAKVNMSTVTEYLPSMEEYRVPVKGIISHKIVKV